MGKRLLKTGEDHAETSVKKVLGAGKVTNSNIQVAIKNKTKNVRRSQTGRQRGKSVVTAELVAVPDT